MLRLAVGRGAGLLGQKTVQDRGRCSTPTRKTELSYIICDARAGGAIIQHSSAGFEELFGENSKGRRLSDLLCQSLPALQAFAAAAGLSEETAFECMERMAKSSEEAMIKTREKESGTFLSLFVTLKDGEPVVYEMSWQKKTHPVLGWSYHVGMQRDISQNICAAELLHAAREELAYQRMCEDWSSKVGPAMFEKLDPYSNDLHGVAEKMWKDELAKGIKPTSTRKTEADTSSVWSRSTASTMASKKSSSDGQKGKGSGVETFHFGALLGSMDTRQSFVETDKASGGDADLQQSFWSMSEDESWEECYTNSPCSLDMFQVKDPVKHVDISELDSLRTPFVIAAPTVEGCPIALRSAGFRDLTVSRYIQLGSDLREVLVPSSQAKDWKAFCDTAGNLWGGGAGACLFEGVDAGQVPPLPAGEFAFTHQAGFHSIDCFAYAKHVELDDCPFLLVCVECPDADCPKNPVEALHKLSTQLDEVIQRLASHFFYFAPMRRQQVLA